jgi:hypothetical protein
VLWKKRRMAPALWFALSVSPSMTAPVRSLIVRMPSPRRSAAAGQREEEAHDRQPELEERTCVTHAGDEEVADAARVAGGVKPRLE